MEDNLTPIEPSRALVPLESKMPTEPPPEEVSRRAKHRRAVALARCAGRGQGDPSRQHFCHDRRGGV